MSDAAKPTATALRPSDFAVLMLSSGAAPPRQRARDQQADRAGLDIQSRVLQALVSLDPEAEDLEAALMTIVEDLGQPTGPARAIAISLLEEWQAACSTPQWMSHVLDEAVRASQPEGRHGRRLPP